MSCKTLSVIHLLLSCVYITYC